MESKKTITVDLKLNEEEIISMKRILSYVEEMCIPYDRFGNFTDDFIKELKKVLEEARPTKHSEKG